MDGAFRTTPRVIATMALTLLVCACGDSPTGPSTRAQAGEWVGTTTQGSPIRFTVSDDEKVTAITVGYSFNGCSGSHTFSNLSLNTAPDVICIPGPCPGTITSYRHFSYSNGSLDGPFTSLNGLFLTPSRAEGRASFRNYPGCDSALDVTWSATRR